MAEKISATDVDLEKYKSATILSPSKPRVKEIQIVQARDFHPESNKAGIVSVNDE